MSLLGDILRIGGAIASFVPGIGWAARAAIFIGTSFVASRMDAKEMRSSLRESRESGQKVNVRGNVEPIPIIYGEVNQVSGAIVWQVTHGSPNTPTVVDSTEYLTTVLVWSEGPVYEIADVRLNDIHQDQERFAGLFDASHSLGTDDQAADSYLVSIAASPANPALAGKWTADHRLRGVAYSRVTLRYSQGAFGMDGIPTLTARVKGRTCWDPRPDAYVWTQNPAIIALDYMLDSRFGMGVPVAEIDVASFEQAASFCDESVAGLANRPDRYHCNIVLDPTADPADNLRDIMATCRGEIVYSAGRYRMVIDRPTWPAFILDETTHCTGPWALQLDALGERVNRVRATFVNVVKGDMPDMVIVDDAGYRTADNELLEREIALIGVTDDGQARDLATWEMRSSRYGMVAEFGVLLSALRCEVGDVVQVVHSVPGWTTELMRVIGVSISATDAVRLTLREYDDTVYSAQSANADVPPETSLPDPMQVAAVTGFTLTAVRTTVQNGYLYGIDVAWAAATAQAVSGYHLEWRKTSSSQWTHAVINRADATTYAIRGLDKVEDYTVRIRAYNSIGATSAWTQATKTTFSDAPADVDIANNELIGDPSIEDQNYWNLSGSATWMPGGGPDGGAAIRIVGSSGYFYENPRARHPGAPSNDIHRLYAATASNNILHVWLTCRRLTPSSPDLRVYVSWASNSPNQVINPSYNSLDAQTIAISLGSQPVGEWVTRGPFQIGPFYSQWAADGFPHRIFLGVSASITSGGLAVEVSNMRAIRVEA